MSRRLLNFLTALSLALCVAAAVLWVRSFVTQDGVEVGRHTLVERRLSEESWKVWSGWRGGVALTWVYRSDSVHDDANARRHGWYGPDERWRVRFPDEGGAWRRPDPGRTRWGFGVERYDSTLVPPHSKFRGDVMKYWTVVVPWAVPAGLLAVLPVLWMAAAGRRRRRERRAREGFCVRCGYDLGASPGRCPECGDDAAGAAGGGSRVIPPEVTS